MPKLDKVTNRELQEIYDSLDGPLIAMQEMSNRMDKGYIDRIDSPAEIARQFALVAREASAMTAQLLMLDRLQRQMDELERLRKSAEPTP